ncbi:septum formation inhibitor Maf [Paraneptunicella aestuarii]|uniref:Maf family protein n=1 Tax=Paraneptunicella aestuarii TaxID=2831148 RepID=UPI001E37BCFB|nr:Maf family protein [Paraneptunicella aestuarii]UAA39105.1 septum formation inhibitor Maf [Paraneptunicella aestuarii]
MSTQLILASQSPRRAELLSQIGVSFLKYPGDVDETPLYNEPPLDYVERMAREKAHAVATELSNSELAKQHQRLVILGSDTIGECNGEVLVKPTDFNDFKRMMQMMSGSIHYVHTAIAVSMDGQVSSQVVTTEVEFGQLTEADINWYWLTGEPHDKAGGYAIQGLAGQFVKQIRGSYSAVVGLPLYETVQMLKQAGIRAHEW